jgi:hypothetical protein
MQQFGGIDSKRHFTVVMGDKEHGLYVSSTPSSAAKKAVTKLCAKNKGKKVEFSMREITQGSKKKTYGPYLGYIEKLKDPIELKGRIIKYKSVVKLQKKEGGEFFSYIRKKIKTSEFNRNATGQLTSNAKNKMLENFKEKLSSEKYKLKIRDDKKKTDTLYFGYENKIKLDKDNYYPFSIYNIVHNKNELIYYDNVFKKIVVNNEVLKFRILIFDNSKYEPLLKELESIRLKIQSPESKPELKEIITEGYFVDYGEFNKKYIFLEFNLKFYYQLLNWIYKFGTITLDNSKEINDLLTRDLDSEFDFLFLKKNAKTIKYIEDKKEKSNVYEAFRSFRDFDFKECIKLINNIYENLSENPEIINKFYNYKYQEAIIKIIKEIREYTHNFIVNINNLPKYIYEIYKSEQKIQQKIQQEQLQNQYQKEQEFISKVKSLCNPGYKPVQYDLNDNIQYCEKPSKPEDKCCLMQSRTKDKCIGCEKITVEEKLENSARQVFQSTTNGLSRVGEVVQKLTPRLTTTPRQLQNLGHRFIDAGKSAAETAMVLPTIPFALVHGMAQGVGRALNTFFPGKQQVYSNGPHFIRGQSTGNTEYNIWKKKMGWT